MVFEDSLDMEANIKNHYNYFFLALESSFKYTNVIAFVTTSMEVQLNTTSKEQPSF